MGAWCYCPKCDRGHGKPSVYEVIDGYRNCEGCGQRMLAGQTKDGLLIDLAECLHNVEEQLARHVEELDGIRSLVTNHFNQGPNS